MKRFWKRKACCLSCDSLSQITRRAICAMLLFASGWPLLCAQSERANQLPGAQPTGSSRRQAADGLGYTLHVTAREVVVEVVARDHEGHPVNDLTRNDFEAFEGTRTSKDGTKRFTGLPTIDPASDTDASADHPKSVVLPLGGRCEIRSTVHYELAFHPSRWTSGYHSNTVSTTRARITFSY
jgi:hypothetical protein